VKLDLVQEKFAKEHRETRGRDDHNRLHQLSMMVLNSG